MNRPWATAAACVAGTLLAVVLLWPGREPARPTPDDDAARKLGLHASMMQAPSGADTAAASPAIDNPLPAVAPTAAASTPQPAVTMSPVPMSYEHEQLAGPSRGTSSDLHLMLESEPKDTGWAYAAEQQLRRTYEEAGTDIYSLECRSTLCEVQAFSASDAASAERLRQAGNQATTEYSGQLVFSAPLDGRTAHLAYYFRQGSSTPP
ncbi:hypothetical protein AACH06_29055 [Ideonella sp. DXS29W]|uniref:Uncharacterized protein n=1 Tax=Ideonella lacteola TaxID=2984193 RepID=A0ABU9BY22_9BURK